MDHQRLLAVQDEHRYNGSYLVARPLLHGTESQTAMPASYPQRRFGRLDVSNLVLTSWPQPPRFNAK